MSGTEIFWYSLIRQGCGRKSEIPGKLAPWPLADLEPRIRRIRSEKWKRRQLNCQRGTVATKL